MKLEELKTANPKPNENTNPHEEITEQLLAAILDELVKLNSR